VTTVDYLIESIELANGGHEKLKYIDRVCEAHKQWKSKEEYYENQLPMK